MTLRYAAIASAARANRRPAIASAARSAIMIVGAFVFDPTNVGITEASTTRSPAIPRTRKSASTTAIWSSSRPILQVPTG